MAPIVGVAMRDEIDQNNSNLEKLENFNIFKGCADSYTQINTDKVSKDLNEAYDAAQQIRLWFWISLSMFFFELFFLLMGVFAKFCCKQMLEQRARQDYLLTRNHEPTALVTEQNNKPSMPPTYTATPDMPPAQNPQPDMAPAYGQQPQMMPVYG